MLDKMDMFPDGVHPDGDGATEIAKIIYEGLTKIVTHTTIAGSKLNEVVLYPNPAAQEFFIAGAEIAEYLIKDSGGKTVSSGAYIPGKGTSVSGLANGTYTCIIIEKGVIKNVEKLTVNR
jgi:hypothetical protein